MAIAAVTATLLAQQAVAVTYPEKPIRMIVAVPPAGPADTLSRLISPKLTDALGQTIVIDNRAGANGNIAYEMTARAVPDGYTITAVAAGVAINPSLYRDVKFDPVRDFAAITLGITVPNVLVVHPSVAATSVKELIALAKAKPGELNFASPGTGTTGHLGLELFKMMAKVDMVHIPYKGAGPAVADLLGGQVSVAVVSVSSAQTNIKAGRLRALGVTSAQRFSGTPEIPTIAEAALPGFDTLQWWGLVAPRGTPADVVNKIAADAGRLVASPEMRERMLALGAEPVASSPDR
ncbi:MAG TPA: tripartite tricarboxylate transporter substrate binding protein, partial [Burkholderiales bacterium]|nr:tripartite tricarboxylate transporter substrate binding protein [Burkholderiales bacterium]